MTTDTYSHEIDNFDYYPTTHDEMQRLVKLAASHYASRPDEPLDEETALIAAEEAPDMDEDVVCEFVEESLNEALSKGVYVSNVKCLSLVSPGSGWLMSCTVTGPDYDTVKEQMSEAYGPDDIELFIGERPTDRTGMESK